MERFGQSILRQRNKGEDCETGIYLVCSRGRKRFIIAGSKQKENTVKKKDQRNYQSHIIYRLIGCVKTVGFYCNCDCKDIKDLQREG